MKAKYEKMIDEYVKKHYGDLDREVLSPEAKYKILFKIYKKKYKREKQWRKCLREAAEHIFPAKLEVAPKADGFSIAADAMAKTFSPEDWKMYHPLCDICMHRNADEPFCHKDMIQNKEKECCEFEAEEERKASCTDCRYSTFKTVTDGREAATGKMWCTKNDFETSGVTSCDWFENKKDDSYLDWLHDDITWCCRECSDKDCGRNKVNRRCKEGLFSVADMYDPFRCPVDAEMPEEMK